MTSLREEVESLRHRQPRQQPDLEGVRDRILKNLKLGTQAPGYKVARKALDQFIRELSHE
jgi:hypothetical protein